VDEKSGFAGFVTAFELDGSHLSNFGPHIVGSSEHVEYWIPAESLSSFNDAIRGPIRLENGFFGAAFSGHIPDAFGLKGKDAIAQYHHPLGWGQTLSLFPKPLRKDFIARHLALVVFVTGDPKPDGSTSAP
jgi:hypothetical protein